MNTTRVPRAELTVEVWDKYWQLWAMSVVGTNLAEHCQKSLIGPRVRNLGPGLPLGQPLQRVMPATYDPLLAYYVCGVSWYNDLARNAHLLAVPAAGESCEVEFDWGRFELTNARRIQIVPDFIDPADPHANVRVYRTCRNWQAAWMLRGGPMFDQPPAEPPAQEALL